MSAAEATGWLAYCRQGFEAEVATELSALAPEGEVRIGEAWVLCYTEAPLPELVDSVFARQLLQMRAIVDINNPKDRLTPVVEAIRTTREQYSALLLEAPDTSQGREQSAFIKRFTPILHGAMMDARLLATGSRKTAAAKPILHVLFADAKTVLLATRETGAGSDWPMGVPRIRVGGDAPSRSAAKIAEAFLVMLGEELTSQVLVPGQRAVDLGAAPGGWSWWLAGRGMRVIAVDNGPLAQSAHATGMIDHVRNDGFRYRPRGRVEWLVCDMVEQPKRIAQLVAGWLADGAARHALFNLKLPMKKRLAEVAVCREVIEKTLTRAGVAHRLVIKQLYHDREEVTALILRD